MWNSVSASRQEKRPQAYSHNTSAAQAAALTSDVTAKENVQPGQQAQVPGCMIISAPNSTRTRRFGQPAQLKPAAQQPANPAGLSLTYTRPSPIEQPVKRPRTKEMQPFSIEQLGNCQEDTLKLTRSEGATSATTPPYPEQIGQQSLACKDVGIALGSTEYCTLLESEPNSCWGEPPQAGNLHQADKAVFQDCYDKVIKCPQETSARQQGLDLFFRCSWLLCFFACFTLGILKPARLRTWQPSDQSKILLL